MFWPEMIQPVTKNVLFIQQKRGLLQLDCKTEGASIGYQIDKNIGTRNWQLYYEPIKVNRNQKIVARAIRIGFRASEITSN